MFNAAFVNVAHQYGLVEPDPELLKLVEACAKIDGLAEHKEKAAMLIEIDEFYQRNQEAKTK